MDSCQLYLIQDAITNVCICICGYGIDETLCLQRRRRACVKIYFDGRSYGDLDGCSLAHSHIQ